MSDKPSWFKSNKGLTIFIGFLLVIIIGLFAWSQIEKSRFNKRLSQQKQQIISNSNRIIEQNNRDFVYNLVMSLSWAIRSEVLRNNLEQVNLYLNEFVKSREFNLAFYVNNEGIIAVSSDKRMEGVPAEDFYNYNFSNLGEITIDTTGESWMALAPVMGLNQRAGTLVISFNPKKLSEADFTHSE